MKRRNIMRLVALLTKPVHPVGNAAKQRTHMKRIRDPYLSQAGPRRKRIKMVPVTLAMLDDQSCFLSRIRVFLISGRRGAIANHTKNAMKKANLNGFKENCQTVFIL
jgi:hypothetical protein